jgi:TorA maturation chaperone TorD
MIGDRELLLFRQEYYKLLVSLFGKEPDGELLRHLPDGIDERIQGARNLHALLAEGWEKIASFLAQVPAEDLRETVADEYLRLFVGPYETTVNPYESFYLTGRLWDRPLAGVRSFLESIAIEKQAEYAEPEDFLAFELDVVRWLIDKQLGVPDGEEEARWLKLQADFLREHLLVWVPACAQDIEKAAGANFYRAAATVLQGFLEMERALFQEWGMDKVASLEEARRLHGAMPIWKGPTFEVPGEEPSGPPAAQRK